MVTIIRFQRQPNSAQIIDVSMGRRSMTGGVTFKDRSRIQFDFKFDGVRYCPTLLKTPTEANLRRAREHLAAIKRRIAAGLFRFEEEFPDYRHLHKVVGASGARICSQVCDEYIAHCEARLAKNGMTAATLTSYRKASMPSGVRGSERYRFWKFAIRRSLGLQTQTRGRAKKRITTRSASCGVRLYLATETIRGVLTRHTASRALE
jgi:Arm DNA-binding domain